MSSYIKATDFASKDALLTGNPLKIVSGTEIDDEFNAIQTAVNTKADTNSPTLTGIPIAPTAVAGTSTTQLATTAFVGTAVSTALGTLGTMSTQNANAVDIDGGTIDNTVIGGTTPAAITGTTITSNSGFSGDLTGNVTGNVTGTLTGNASTATVATRVSGFSVTTSQNSTSASLLLGSGTWAVVAWFSYYDDNYPAVSLRIGGVTVSDTANRGDPTGTSFITLQGVRTGVTGASVTIDAPGATTDDASIVAIAYRTA